MVETRGRKSAALHQRRWRRLAVRCLDDGSKQVRHHCRHHMARNLATGCRALGELVGAGELGSSLSSGAATHQRNQSLTHPWRDVTPMVTRDMDVEKASRCSASRRGGAVRCGQGGDVSFERARATDRDAPHRTRAAVPYVGGCRRGAPVMETWGLPRAAVPNGHMQSPAGAGKSLRRSIDLFAPAACRSIAMRVNCSLNLLTQAT